MALQQTEFRQINLVATDIADDHVLAEQQGSGSFLYEQITGDLLKKIIIAMNKDVNLMSNVGLSVVANTPTNGLTIALKQADGTDPSATHKNKCVIAFRSGTITSGTVVFREVTSALSTIISSGSTAGFTANKAEKLHIYLIDNAGTVEIAWSGSYNFDERILHSTTEEGGAGAADSKTVLYSTTARTDVAVRYLGYAILTEATPGTWVTNPSQIFIGRPQSAVETIAISSSGVITGGSYEIHRYNDGYTKIKGWIAINPTDGNARDQFTITFPFSFASLTYVASKFSAARSDSSNITSLQSHVAGLASFLDSLQVNAGMTSLNVLTLQIGLSSGVFAASNRIAASFKVEGYE